MTLSTKFAEKERQTRIIIEGVGKQNSELEEPIKKISRILIEILKNKHSFSRDYGQKSMRTSIILC
jgi:hypothetical protein